MTRYRERPIKVMATKVSEEIQDLENVKVTVYSDLSPKTALPGS